MAENRVEKSAKADIRRPQPKTPQDRLERERQQLASVIEATEVAIWELDIPSSKVEINDRWASLIGQTRAELEPVTLETFDSRIHPDDLTPMRTALERHLRGETRDYECEVRMRHKDGRWVWLLTRGRVLERDADGLPLRMFGVHLDIAQRKAQEATLRRARELLESTGKLAHVGGWELDLLTEELTWTDETKRIHGVGLDYVPTLEAAVAFYTKEAQQAIRDAMDEALETGTPWDLEVPLIRADGEKIWVHAQGRVELEGKEPVRLFGAFQDITEHRKLLQSVADSRELLRVTLESIGDGVITTDRQGAISWLNPVAERLTGWDEEIAQGRPVDDVFYLVNEHTRKPVAHPINSCLAEQRIVNLEQDTLLLSKDGAEHGIEDSAAPILNEDGSLLGAVMVFRDVTEQRRLSVEMRYRARHDSLTGLINRAEFESRLEALLSRNDDDDAQHGVLYIDLDQFKLVNDTGGHSVGDQLLQNVAGILSGAVRSHDTVARLGGDEFGMILEHCPAEQTLRVAEKVCENLRDFQFVHEEHRFHIGSSIGVVQMRAGWPSVSAVLQAADTACYAAKEAGRDRVHVYADSDDAIVGQRRETHWVRKIEAALEKDRFVLCMQPIVPADPFARSRATRRMELLLRMRGDEEELIPPAGFLAVAERFHLISRIDRWVIETARRWLECNPGGNSILFSNLSGRSIGDRVFQRFALGLIEEMDVPLRGRLVFEITETSMITHLPLAREFLEAIQRLGVHVALDDFGSGMASFGYLRSLPLDYLKIDGQFVRSMLEDDLALAAVRAFIDVASVLKIPTIAEHVENEAVMEALLEMGVHYAQGYHLGRPMLADKATMGG